jgi:hypothetical protein
LKCDAGGGWRRPDGTILCEMKYYKESMRRRIFYMK